jgi:hypothetical protein
MKRNVAYTTIQHIPRKKMGLSNNEYCIADSIHKLSHNKDFPWCVESRERLGDFIGLSKRSAISIIQRLVAKGIIEEQPRTKLLRSTNVWFEEVITYVEQTFMGEESSPLVKKVHTSGEETTPQAVKKVHTISKDKKKDNDDVPLSEEELIQKGDAQARKWAQ